jgi:predicted nucleic-acid-binding protein
VGDAWFAPLALGRLPATGYLGLAQFPAVELAREYIFDYRARPGASSVLDDGDEFFDTLALRADRQKPLEVAGQPVRVPYRVLIRMLATDNRVQSGANDQLVVANQVSQSPETFEFNVVAEEDLLIEAGKREEALHETTEEIITNLKKQSELLKKLIAEFPTLKPEEFRRVAADVGDVLKSVREEKVRVDVEVAREFRHIYRELVLNRVTEQVLTRIDGRICRPLEGLVLPGAEFSRTDEALDRLGRLIEAEQARTPRDALATAGDELNQLILRLEEIAKEMKRLMEFNRALQELREIIKGQEEINRLLEEKWKKEKDRELGGKP